MAQIGKTEAQVLLRQSFQPVPQKAVASRRQHKSWGDTQTHDVQCTKDLSHHTCTHVPAPHTHPGTTHAHTSPHPTHTLAPHMHTRPHTLHTPWACS